MTDSSVSAKYFESTVVDSGLNNDAERDIDLESIHSIDLSTFVDDNELHTKALERHSKSQTSLGEEIGTIACNAVLNPLETLHTNTSVHPQNMAMTHTHVSHPQHQGGDAKIRLYSRVILAFELWMVVFGKAVLTSLPVIIFLSIYYIPAHWLPHESLQEIHNTVYTFGRRIITAILFYLLFWAGFTRIFTIRFTAPCILRIGIPCLLIQMALQITNYATGYSLPLLIPVILILVQYTAIVVALKSTPPPSQLMNYQPLSPIPTNTPSTPQAQSVSNTFRSGSRRDEEDYDENDPCDIIAAYQSTQDGTPMALFKGFCGSSTILILTYSAFPTYVSLSFHYQVLVRVGIFQPLFFLALAYQHMSLSQMGPLPLERKVVQAHAVNIFFLFLSRLMLLNINGSHATFLVMAMLSGVVELLSRLTYHHRIRLWVYLDNKISSIRARYITPISYLGIGPVLHRLARPTRLIHSYQWSATQQNEFLFMSANSSLPFVIRNARRIRILEDTTVELRVILIAPVLVYLIQPLIPPGVLNISENLLETVFITLYQLAIKMIVDISCFCFEIDYYPIDVPRYKRRMLQSYSYDVVLTSCCVFLTMWIMFT